MHLGKKGNELFEPSFHYQSRKCDCRVCVVLVNMAPIGSHICILSLQLLHCLGRIRFTAVLNLWVMSPFTGVTKEHQKT